MALLDDINFALRDFEVVNSANPAPTGDPTSGRHNIKLHELRELLITIAQTMGDPSALSILIDEMRNGRVWVLPTEAGTPSGDPIPAGVLVVLSFAGDTLKIWRRGVSAPADEKETVSVQKDANGVWWYLKLDAAGIDKAISDLATDLANGRVYVLPSGTPTGKTIPTGTDGILSATNNGTQFWVPTSKPASGTPESDTLQRDAADQWWARALDSSEIAAERAERIAEALKGYRANLGNFVGVGIAAGPVPIVVSADNRVLISSDVMSALTSSDVMSLLTHYRLSLGEFLGQLPQNASPPAMVSADNRVLIGTGGSASSPTVNAIWTNDGQSNAEGSTDGSSSLVYPGETASVLTLARGARHDQWLGLATGGGDSVALDGGQITAIAPMAVEMSALNHGTTAAEAAARAASRWGRAPIVIWSNAEGGQSIANLLPSPPAGYYGFSNTVTALERAQAVRSPGMRLVYEWMLMHQGESNTGESNLGLLHDQLRAAVDAEAKRILGQHEAVRMISWQPSSFSLSNGARSILQHALDHAEDGAFFCGGPSYGFPWYEPETAATAAFLHHSSRGHAMRGEMAAAIIRRIESEGRYLPLHAVGAAITGANEITVTLSEMAEAATDSVVQPVANLGITLTGASVSGAVVSGDRLIVTTTGAASDATAVNLGLLGQTNPRTEARIPRTNIRAKAPLGTYSWGGLIRAWMCHQAVAIS